MFRGLRGTDARRISLVRKAIDHSMHAPFKDGLAEIDDKGEPHSAQAQKSQRLGLKDFVVFERAFALDDDTIFHQLVDSQRSVQGNVLVLNRKGVLSLNMESDLLKLPCRCLFTD